MLDDTKTFFFNFQQVRLLLKHLGNFQDQRHQLVRSPPFHVKLSARQDTGPLRPRFRRQNEFLSGNSWGRYN